ncbi:hypothetical protein N0V90_006775 [Kalmusia sp. IMI 367209]|nr:hypothetical protein N0V90_006775 [Kalmusia sp. IMI 367209]
MFQWWDKVLKSMMTAIAKMNMTTQLWRREKTTKPKTKTTPKKNTTPKKKTPKKKKQPKACPLPGQKGKKGKSTGKKTIRDIAEDYLPQVIGRALFPRGNQQSTNNADDCAAAPWYQKTVLSKKAEVDWWSFTRKDNKWEESIPKNHPSRKVLTHLHLHGKFDAVKLTKAKLELEGDPNTAILPSQVAKGTGKYLLTNGGFFNPSTVLTERRPIGDTSLSPVSDPIPDLYREYYKELREGSHFLQTGPSLKHSVPLENDEFEWKEANYDIAGSLAHGSQSNERLAIATVGRDKYIFAYTAVNRFEDGVTFNELRTIIDAFFKAFTTIRGVEHATEVLNLDGGGSVFVAWRKRGAEQLIARGDVNDDGPPFNDGFRGKNPRAVANFLKLVVA